MVARKGEVAISRILGFEMVRAIYERVRLRVFGRVICPMADKTAIAASNSMRVNARVDG